MLRSILRQGYSLLQRARLRRLGRDITFRPVFTGISPASGGTTSMRLDPTDPYEARMILGDWEPYLALCMAKVVRQGETCVDVGAHKGYFTLLFARLVGNGGAVLSVDPDPRVFALLRENLAYNNITNVFAHQVALSDGPGRVDLALSRQLGWSSRFPNERAAPLVIGKIQAEAMSLDELLAQQALPRDGRMLSFIKIDAEGSEPRILAGMDRTVRKHQPILHLEVNLGSLRVARTGDDRFMECIAAPPRRWGYVAFELAGQRALTGRRRLRLVKVDLGHLDRSIDLICAAPTSPLAERISPYLVQ